MKRILILFLMLLPCAVMAQEAKQDSLKLLFVGNSYTYYNDLPQMVYEIAKTQKKKLSVSSVTKGGERLSGHLKNKKLREMLTSQEWDFVILQEQSSAPAKPTANVIADIYPAAKSLDSLIHVGSPNAKTIFYMTWGHKNGTTHKIDNYPLAYTYQGMQERIKTTYLEMTYQNNASCAPVGMAWQRVRSERPDYQLYTQDCSHPSKLGTYLAANVIYMTLFGQQYQTAYTADFDSEKAEYIQRTAQETVLQNKDVLNIK